MSKANYRTLQLLNDGSHKFSYASCFLKDEVILGISYIYQWIDYCKEAIDEGKYNETIDSLKDKTRVITAQSPLPPPFESLKNVMKKYSIPFHYPLEFLEGLRTKAEKRILANQSDLELYCYRGRSTVGLMISHVMGITHHEALKSIKDLGIAIELTHMANHLSWDLQKGLCFIPQELLNKYDISAYHLMENEKIIYRISCDLIKRSQDYFLSGLNSLDHLSFRSGLLLFHIIRLHQEIGKKITRQGYLSEPIRISSLQKIFIFIKCTAVHSQKYLPMKMRRPKIMTFSKTTKFEERM